MPPNSITTTKIVVVHKCISAKEHVYAVSSWLSYIFSVDKSYGSLLSHFFWFNLRVCAESPVTYTLEIYTIPSQRKVPIPSFFLVQSRMESMRITPSQLFLRAYEGFCKSFYKSAVSCTTNVWNFQGTITDQWRN